MELDNATRNLRATAIRHLKSGEPVPLDIVFGLTDAGVDFSDLEARYAQ